MDTALDTPPVLADYIRPVWQRKWLVILIVVLATGITYAYAKHQRKVYNAGTLVYYQPAGDPLNGGQSFTTDRALQDVAALLYSADNATAVAKQIGYPGPPGQLLAQVTISDRIGEDFVAISASATDPQQAARIANGYARQLVAVTNSELRTKLAQEIQGLQRQLAQIGNKTLNDQATRLSLTTQLTTTRSALLIPTATRQVSAAAPPSAASSPKPAQDAIFAFVLSLALAVAVAFGLERFDRRIKKSDDLADAYGLPLVAALPHVSNTAPSSEHIAALDPGFHEAFGLLRTNINLLTLDAPPKAIAVVSAMPGEGKSTVVRNLAISLAESGSRVAVVEADLRRPVQGSLMRISGGSGLGLTDVLTGAATLSEALCTVPIQAPGIEMLADIGAAGQDMASANGHSDRPGKFAISVLLAGTLPPNPATVLESKRVLEVFNTLRSMYDVLLFDSAPMLSVTDSVPLVRCADAVIIVGRLNLTTRDHTRRMTNFLGRVPDARLLGVIANDVTAADSYGYGYGYGYRDSAAITRARDQPTQPSQSEPAEKG